MKRGAGRKNKRVVAFDDTLAALAAQEAAAEAENAVGANEASDWAMPMDEASDGGSDDDGDEIAADFEFYPFHEADWHSVKQHCSRLLDGRAWDAGGLATAVAEQQLHVGSAIKLGARTTEALAVAALLNLQQYAGAPWAAAVCDFCLAHFEEGDARRVMLTALSPTARTALVVNERVINVPPLLALPLHESLFEEMHAANEAHAAHRLPGRGPYDVDHLLFITVAYNDRTPGGMERKKQRDRLEWFRPEEEVYFEHAVCHSMWPIAPQDMASRWTFEGAITQHKVVMLVPTTAIPSILRRFEEINMADFDEDGEMIRE